MALAMIAVLGMAGRAGAQSPEPDWLALARTRGEAGFYAARDASARKATESAHDDTSRLAALKLLADTAERTGDWTVLDAATSWPRPPGPDCACDALAWHAAIVIRRTARHADALGWLAAVSPDSLEGDDAALLRAEWSLWGGAGSDANDRAAKALESLVRARYTGNGHARAMRERATLELARLRCTPATYTEATARLDTLTEIEPGGVAEGEIALARAWCAADARRSEELTALLPTLDAAERKGAWLPSLPLLHALAEDDPAARRHGLEAVVAGIAPLWRQLDGTAVALAGMDRTPSGWKFVLSRKTGLPHGLVAQLQSSDLVAGLTGRFAALDREDRVAKDPAVRAELQAERVAATRRAARALSTLLGAYAREVGGISEHAAWLLKEMDASSRRPAAEAIPELTTEAAQQLRAIEGQMGDPGALTRGEIAFRIADLELGRVPLETTIETLRAALAVAPDHPRRESMAWTLAVTLLDAGREAEAEATLRTLAAVSPRGPKGWQAHALLGDLAFARKEFNRAGRAYAVAMGASDRPLALYAAYRFAWCAWATNRPAVASATLAKVIADPDTPPALRASAEAETALLGTCRKGRRCKE